MKEKSVDNGGAFGALFTDLSKAFDCLSPELLDRNGLKLIKSYLSKSKDK